MKQSLEYSGKETSFVNTDKQEILEHGTTEFRLSVHETTIKRGINQVLHYHWHDELEFLILFEGAMRLHVGSNEYILQEGDIAVILPDTPHTAYRVDPQQVRYSATLVNQAFLASQENDLIQKKYIMPFFMGWDNIPEIITKDNAVNARIAEVLSQIRKWYKFEEYGFELLIKGGLYHILGELTSCFDQSPSPAKNQYNTLWVRQLLQFINENYSRTVTLEEMAGYTNMSKSYMCRCVKRVFRTTPLEFVTRYRLSRAVNLIESTNKKLVDISYETGFSNVNRFTTIFKKYYACTPQQYRKNMLPERSPIKRQQTSRTNNS